MATHALPPAARVLVITMFDSTPEEATGEAHRWIAREHLHAEPPLAGLASEYPHPWADRERGLWLLTTGMGEANAAAGVSAFVLGGSVDLRNAYVLIAGIAGIDPRAGTLGSAVWTDHVVHGGYAHEIDAREMPGHWPYGYVPLGAEAPGKPPAFRIEGDVFALDPALVRAAAALTAAVPLADSPRAARLRAGYGGPGGRPPAVSTGASLTQSVFWSGRHLNARARAWVDAFTGGRGRYTTTQMEDNATLTALHRAAAAGLLDFERVAVLRTGANFDQARPGDDPHRAMLEDAGWPVAAENAYRVGAHLVHRILEDWDAWSRGVPELESEPCGKEGGVR